MATRIKGDAELLAIWNGTDAYETVGCLTSLGLTESVNTVESITKCSGGNVIKEGGTRSYEMSIEGEYVQPENGLVSWAELRPKFRTGETITWRITTVYPNNTTDVEYGTGFFSDLEKTSTTKDENITFSTTFQGSGEITATDPN